MYAKIDYPNGTSVLFEIVQFSTHVMENNPKRITLVFDRKDEGWGTGMQIDSEKDLAVFIMNNNGKTIDRRIYRQ